MAALLAFFMESTFIGLWIFGRNKLPPKPHPATTWGVQPVQRGTHACLRAAGGYYARMLLAAQGTRHPGAERSPAAERRHP